MESRASFFLIIALLFLLFACEEERYNMLTTVNRDGTCVRTFTEKVDSAFLLGDTAEHHPFPFQPDTSWSVQWRHDSGNWKQGWPLDTLSNPADTLRPVVQVSRVFPSADRMAQFDYLSRGPWEPFFPKFRLKKSFRWFYTEWNVQETFPSIDSMMDFTRVPVTNYLKEEEVKLWTQGNDTCFSGMNGREISTYMGEIKQKYDAWFFRNNFELEYEAVMKLADSLHFPPASKAKLAAAKDSVFTIYKQQMEERQIPDLDVVPALDTYFKTKYFSRRFKGDKQLERNIHRSLAFYDYFGTRLHYNLLLPGEIQTSNAREIHGDTLFWKIDAHRFAVYDYNIRAKSRTINWWAFVVTGLALLLVLVPGVLLAKKRLRNA